MELIGREAEEATFRNCMQLTESKLIAIYGRRRVGKTFLIRKSFSSKIVFEISGLHKGNTRTQIKHFKNTLSDYGHAKSKLANPKDWLDVFELLKDYLNTLKSKSKKVIFIDEMPWFETPRSQFLTIFENFWNEYCTKRNDLIVIMCGSAASWMIKKILQNKGGLHNRIHEKIRLKPFTLYETEKFLKAKGIVWDRFAICQVYMCTGGIPFYLDGIRKGEGFVQFINRAFFLQDGFLRTEYAELFSSLFDESSIHREIVELLAKQKKSIPREVIAIKTKTHSGGTLSNVLEELENAGFVNKSSLDINSKSKIHYQLEDFYILFYMHYIGLKTRSNYGNWDKIYASPSWASWAGLAFERICFYHVNQIMKALNITSIESEVSEWRLLDEERGAQIDMLIDRADRVVNVIEMKFSKDKYQITKDYAAVIRNKLARYAEQNPRKILFLTIVTNYGLFENKHSLDLVQNQIELKHLFLK